MTDGKQVAGRDGNPVFRRRCGCDARRDLRRVGRSATAAYPYDDPGWAAMVCPSCDTAVGP